MKKIHKRYLIVFKWLNIFVNYKYIQMFFLLFFSINTLHSQHLTTTDSLEKIIHSNVFDSTRTKSFLQLINIYYQTDTAKAFFYLSQLTNEIENEKYEIQSKWLYELSKFYEKLNDYPNIIKYTNLAYEKANIENKDVKVYYESRLGYLFSSIGEHEKARNHLLNAIETAENNKILKYLPYAYLSYAFELRNVGELDKAIIYFTKSYKKSKEIEDETYIHIAIHEIGNIYTMQRQNLLALEYHKKAMLIREKMESKLYLMYSYYDIAIDYYYLDSISLSLNYYEKAENRA